MKMSVVAGLALVFGLGVLLSACGSNVGRPLGGDAPYHHLENGFRNPPDSPKRTIPFTRRMKFFSQAIWRNAVSEAPSIPRDHAIKRDAAKAQLAAMGDDDFVSWIGHATFLVRLDGVNVLTDPVFSRRASPVSFTGPARLVPPGLFIEDLPPIDVVVISHAHYDHLDTATLDKLRAARGIIDSSGYDIRLEIDGGVKVDNIAEIAAAGADTFVAGSGIFSHAEDGDPNRYDTIVKRMRDELARAASI